MPQLDKKSRFGINFTQAQFKQMVTALQNCTFQSGGWVKHAEARSMLASANFLRGQGKGPLDDAFRSLEMLGVLLEDKESGKHFFDESYAVACLAGYEGNHSPPYMPPERRVERLQVIYILRGLAQREAEIAAEEEEDSCEEQDAGPCEYIAFFCGTEELIWREVVNRLTSSSADKRLKPADVGKATKQSARAVEDVLAHMMAAGVIKRDEAASNGQVIFKIDRDPAKICCVAITKREKVTVSRQQLALVRELQEGYFEGFKKDDLKAFIHANAKLLDAVAMSQVCYSEMYTLEVFVGGDWRILVWDDEEDRLLRALPFFEAVDFEEGAPFVGEQPPITSRSPVSVASPPVQAKSVESKERPLSALSDVELELERQARKKRLQDLERVTAQARSALSEADAEAGGRLQKERDKAAKEADAAQARLNAFETKLAAFRSSQNI